MTPPDPLTPPRLLQKGDDRSHFDCGVPELNDYLSNYALQNQKKSAARTYVAVRANSVVAYYTLVFGSVSPEEAPESITKGAGRYPVPVLILARLAVNVGDQGHGLGEALLKDALHRAIQAARIAGLRAVLVDAKDERAERFYRRFGFVSSPRQSRQLYLSMATLLRNTEDR